MIARSIIKGVVGALALLLLYFAVITIISGWDFAKEQFATFWYFIVPLAVGFGIQIGLYTYLRSVIHNAGASGKVLAVSGVTSTGAMISCCSHYLINILPIIGVTGFVSVISQYQVEFFWVGLAFNVAGILYIADKVVKVTKHSQIA